MIGRLMLAIVLPMYIASTQELQRTAVGNGLAFFGLIGAQLGIVVPISLALNKLAPSATLGLFCPGDIRVLSLGQYCSGLSSDCLSLLGPASLALRAV